jgi:hypothetical protein
MAGVEHEYHLTAKTVNDTIKRWYIPLMWARDNVLPKERIAFRQHGGHGWANNNNIYLVWPQRGT